MRQDQSFVETPPSKENPSAENRGCLQRCFNSTVGERGCQVQIGEIVKTYKVFNYVSVGTNLTSLTSTDNAQTKRAKLTGFDNDKLYELLNDLVNPQFKKWYCKRFYQLGRSEVLKLASIARVDGKDKRKYFSVLLRG